MLWRASQTLSPNTDAPGHPSLTRQRGLGWVSRHQGLGVGAAGTGRPCVIACSGGQSRDNPTSPYWTEPDRPDQNPRRTRPAQTQLDLGEQMWGGHLLYSGGSDGARAWSATPNRGCGGPSMRYVPDGNLERSTGQLGRFSIKNSSGIRSSRCHSVPFAATCWRRYNRR